MSQKYDLYYYYVDFNVLSIFELAVEWMQSAPYR